MRRFQRRNNALEARENLQRTQGLIIRGAHVFGAAAMLEPGMLGADAGIIEPGRDRMRGGDLSGAILKHVRKCSLQHSGLAALEAGSVLAERGAAAAGFNPDESYFFIGNEGV